LDQNQFSQNVFPALFVCCYCILPASTCHDCLISWLHTLVSLKHPFTARRSFIVPPSKFMTSVHVIEQAQLKLYKIVTGFLSYIIFVCSSTYDLGLCCFILFLPGSVSEETLHPKC
jgi:hypothetical protein